MNDFCHEFPPKHCEGVYLVLRVSVLVQLFEPLLRERPEALSKLVAVAGDCSERGLGLSVEDRALLQDRVAVVFHGAASVRFDDPVQKAVLLNTRGAREVVDLCAGMSRLEVRGQGLRIVLDRAAHESCHTADPRQKRGPSVKYRPSG